MNHSWRSTVFATAVVFANAALSAFAQTPTPKFDVAAIRNCKEPPAGRAGPSPNPGRLTINCVPVTSLIQIAYVIYADGRQINSGPAVPIEGGPAWIKSDLYDINAKADDSVTNEMTNGPMLQALLENRFGLK